MNNIESGWSDHLLGHLLVTMVTLLVTGLYGMGRTPAPDHTGLSLCPQNAHTPRTAVLL